MNTVDTAYQLLAAEGWLERGSARAFCALLRTASGRRAAAPAGRAAAAARPLPGVTTFHRRVDTDLFPFRTWGRIQKELLYGQPELLAHGHPQGDEDLRQAIAEYLRAYRGVDCGPGQIVVGAGVEYLLGLVGRLAAGRTAALEDLAMAGPGAFWRTAALPACRCQSTGRAWTPPLWPPAGRTLCT